MAVVSFTEYLASTLTTLFIFFQFQKGRKLERQTTKQIYTCQTLYSIFEPNSLQNVYFSGCFTGEYRFVYVYRLVVPNLKLFLM